MAESREPLPREDDDVLTENCEELIKTLTATKVTNSLRQRRVIDLDDFNEIKEEERQKGRIAGVEKLLDKLHNSGPNGLVKFIESLDYSGFKNMAKKLQESRHTKLNRADDETPNESRPSANSLQKSHQAITNRAEPETPHKLRAGGNDCITRYGNSVVSCFRECNYSAQTTVPSQQISEEHSETSDSKVIRVKETNYVLNNYKIPADVSNYVKECPCVIENICPSEEKCAFCANEPKLIVKRQKLNATIYDIKQIKQGVPVFYKECLVCHYKFRYADYKDGLHMADDTTILTLQLCLLFRASVKHPTAVGGECLILEDALSTTYPANIFEAYRHFEAQTDHGYQFTCAECGSNPPIVILDANRNTCFGIKDSTIIDPPVNMSDEVDMLQFWKQIEQHCLAEMKCKDGINPFARAIQYEGWSQWMAPNSVSSTRSVINTEFKKLQKLWECKKLHEYFKILSCEVSVDFVKDVAKDKGSKMDFIDIPNSNFKLFSESWGRISRSGGFLAMLCHHGVCYGFKPILTTESVSDHVDMILSMKHQPTVIINDVSNMTFHHGDKRKPGMFNPFKGCIVESTDKNISLARDGQLTINMAFLNDLSTRKDFDSSDTHPVTHTDNHYMLANTSSDLLRYAAHVPQLKGIINTQTYDQFFAEIEKQNYFMNKMNPESHLFMLRLLIHFQNDTRNNMLITNMESVKTQGTNVTMNKDQRLKYQSILFTKTREHGDHPQRRSTVHRGINNAHNNCWLNSSMQSLVKIIQDPENLPKFEIDTIDVFIKELYLDKDKPYDPIESLEVLSSCGFEFDRQHDAHEFLLLILQELSSFNLYEPLVFNYETMCGTCSDKKCVPDKHFMLTIAIEESIQAAIDAHLKARIQGRRCPTCLNSELVEKLSILNFPSVIALHLNRFKIMQLPNEAGTLIQKDDRSIDIQRTVHIQINDDVTVYNLSTIICHRGNLVSNGHYWTVHTEVDNKWTFLNDKDIFRTCDSEIFDLNIKTGCYILFYTKDDNGYQTESHSDEKVDIKTDQNNNTETFDPQERKETFCVFQKEDDERKCVLCKVCIKCTCLEKVPFFFCSMCTRAARIQLDMKMKQYCDKQPIHCVQDSYIWKFDQFTKEYIKKQLVKLNKYKIRRLDLKSIHQTWTKKEICTLKKINSGNNEGWLNYEIVNSFISSVVEQRNNVLSDQKYFHLDSFTYSKKRTDLNVKIGSSSFVLLPIIENNLWTLVMLILNKRKWMVRYYCSCNGQSEKIKKIKTFCESNGLSISNVYVEKGPKQLDTKSSGVLVCMRALCAVFGEKAIDPNNEQLIMYRKLIATVIMMQGELILTSGAETMCKSSVSSNQTCSMATKEGNSIKKEMHAYKNELLAEMKTELKIILEAETDKNDIIHTKLDDRLIFLEDENKLLKTKLGLIKEE